MSNEYSELQEAKAAAKQMTGGAKSLIGLLYNKSKTAVANVYHEATEPLSLPEQAKKVVKAKQNRKVRGAKLQLVSIRIGGGIVADTLSGASNIVLGLAKGIVGKLDKSTRALANRASDNDDNDDNDGIDETPASDSERDTHQNNEDPTTLY